MPNRRPHNPQTRGRYFMQRGWQEHPVFPAEPFTAREAWEWLIAEAYWREGRTRAGKFVVQLKRGQLCASVRYLADCWQWEKSKAERFLKRLKSETMIETRSETGISIITICNYDKFQTFAGDNETATIPHSGTGARQRRDKIKEHQDNYTKEDSEESLSLFPAQTAPPAPRKKSNDPPYSTEFEAFWSVYPRHNGSKKEAFKAYQQQVKKGVTHERLQTAVRRYAEFIGAKMGGADFVKHAHRWLKQEDWAIDYTINVRSNGNTISTQGKGAAGYIDVTRQIIEERNAGTTSLEDAPHW